MRKIYIAYAKDKARLPIAVADSPGELARITGRSRGGIESVISKFRRGLIQNPGYVCVEVEDE